MPGFLFHSTSLAFVNTHLAAGEKESNVADRVKDIGSGLPKWGSSVRWCLSQRYNHRYYLDDTGTPMQEAMRRSNYQTKHKSPAIWILGAAIRPHV